MTHERPAIGALLREWRQRRRLSQLDLACEAEISTRHLSFVESGRARPSREMVLRLAERLDVPLRERNALLAAAGFAPVFAERPMTDPALQPARQAIELLLAAHEPYPALAVDRHWTLVTANRAVAPLLAGIDRALLEPPVNVLRLSLHPRGLAPRIVNAAEWRAHVLDRLRRQVALTADRALVALLNEVRALPAGEAPDDRSAHPSRDLGGVVIPLQLRHGGGVLSLLSTTTVFGTPVDITLSELAIESFFPADDATAAALRAASGGGGSGAGRTPDTA
ncbi:MAG TPA: helix-turn-helix transcriptional regulator [Methylomirabilota bacterium]